MKKRIIALVILLLCAFAYQASAATWFAGSGDTDFNAVSSGTTSSVWNSNADGTSGTYLDWSTGPANGDIFVANGATIAIDDSIGSESVTVTLTTEGTDYGGTDGGGFTAATTTLATKTLYVNTISGTTDCLSVSGNQDGTPALTIRGNQQGGTTTGKVGLYSVHSVGTIAVVGNALAVAGQGIYNGASGPMTLTGNCTGSDTANLSGCNANSTGAITVKGNLISGKRSTGGTGTIIWTPATPADGVTGNYIKMDGGGTEVFAGTNTDDATKALSTFYYIDPTDGTSDQGSATTESTGGGAWGW
jgi:hypothetical protein